MEKTYKSKNGDHLITVKDKSFLYFYDNGRDLSKFEFPIYNQFTPREILKIFLELTNDDANQNGFLKFLRRHDISVTQSE